MRVLLASLVLACIAGASGCDGCHSEARDSAPVPPSEAHAPSAAQDEGAGQRQDPPPWAKAPTSPSNLGVPEFDALYGEIVEIDGAKYRMHVDTPDQPSSLPFGMVYGHPLGGRLPEGRVPIVDHRGYRLERWWYGGIPTDGGVPERLHVVFEDSEGTEYPTQEPSWDLIDDLDIPPSLKDPQVQRYRHVSTRFGHPHSPLPPPQVPLDDCVAYNVVSFLAPHLVDSRFPRWRVDGRRDPELGRTYRWVPLVRLSGKKTSVRVLMADLDTYQRLLHEALVDDLLRALHAGNSERAKQLWHRSEPDMAVGHAISGYRDHIRQVGDRVLYMRNFEFDAGRGMMDLRFFPPEELSWVTGGAIRIFTESHGGEPHVTRIELEPPEEVPSVLRQLSIEERVRQMGYTCKVNSRCGPYLGVGCGHGSSRVVAHPTLEIVYETALGKPAPGFYPRWLQIPGWPCDREETPRASK